MDISVIIVSWNAKAYLQECLESLINELSNYTSEIIVVDNASKDGSPEYVANNFPQVKLIRNQINLGFSKANNIGIKASSGKYLFLVNSDIKVIKGCINKMVEFGENNPNIGIIGPKILTPVGMVQRSCMAFPTIWNTFCRTFALDSLFPNSKAFGEQLLTYWNHNSTKNVDVINGCFWLVRREALNQVGLLDEKFFIYGEDIDWCKRFWQKGWPIMFYADAAVIHYGGASSSNEPVRFFVEMNRANIYYWEKHYGSIKKILYIVLLIAHNLLRIIGQSIMYLFNRQNRVNIQLKIKRSYVLLLWIFGLYETEIFSKRNI